MFEIDTEDFSYLFRGGTPLRARIYRPRGRGPFPAMVDGHGGAWIRGRLESNDPINRRVAASGVIVMTIDYSLPPVGTYPSSVADINYAVRWLKLNAAKYETKPEWVGVMGTSAGGHLAVLTAIKPADLRYTSLSLEDGSSIDARVCCVIAMWPVICPYTRFQENLDRKARGDERFATRAGAGLDQLKYWVTQDAMSDGSPMLALERGEDVEIPNILYIQAEGDLVHPRHCMDRFCEAYRKKGGHIETVLLKGEPDDLVRKAPESAEAKRAMKKMIEFIHESKARFA